MSYVPKIIFNQFEKLTKNEEEYKKYCNAGYSILYEPHNSEIVVYYCKKEYRISIIELDEILYWHLEPYNGSVFNTRIDATSERLKMVLFAIKENEELYSKKVKGINEQTREQYEIRLECERTNCFAWRTYRCNALTVKDCSSCRFYKDKNKVEKSSKSEK